MTRYELVAGSENRYTFVVKLGTVRQDIDGWTFWLTAKLEDSHLADIFFQITSGAGIAITDGDQGEALVTIPASAVPLADLAEVDTMWWNLHAEDSGGAGPWLLAEGEYMVKHPLVSVA